MPPAGTLAASSLSMGNERRERLYKVWPGNNKFVCGGRSVFGPDAGSLYSSSFLIGCPAFMFCIRMVVRIEEHDPLYGYGVFTIGVVLTFLDLMFLYMTSGRDPGIVPRNSRLPVDDECESNTPAMDWVGGKNPTRLPRTKDVAVNGFTIKVKFCDTCKIYRPPRASHCSVCNNCVQRFDHHCPWVGQCIGQRNYRYFILFISTTTLLCIYVFTFSLINLLRRSKGVLHSFSDDIVSVILVVYCFVVVWFVGGLTVFHLYLMSTNQTTYENFRYGYDKDSNPYNLGWLNNLKQMIFTKIPPSAVNFREMVVIEDVMVMVPVTPSYHNVHTEFRKNENTNYGDIDDKKVSDKAVASRNLGRFTPQQLLHGNQSRVEDVIKSSRKFNNIDAS